MTTFNEMLKAKWNEGKFVCIGLDSEHEKIPQCIRVNCPTKREGILRFNERIVNATGDKALAYKPNLAFYLGHGPWGFQALLETIEYIRRFAPDVPVILDAKDMDIGNTNVGYVQMAFEQCGADAITVNPYLGMEAAQPFLDQKDKGIIVLCRTSNKGAGEFQDLSIRLATMEPGQKREEFLRLEQQMGHELSDGSVPLYQYVAFRVAEYWNKNGNCALVVGATYPDELREVRRIVGDMPILIPGVGAQGGDVEATVMAGKNSHGQGMIINSSRGIIFASYGSDFAEAARRETEKLNNLINQYRN
ncbi:MAG: orotidine-5'-phosphate decarboxylase [Candidatus Moraniibacteriota bacterium]